MILSEISAKLSPGFASEKHSQNARVLFPGWKKIYQILRNNPFQDAVSFKNIISICESHYKTVWFNLDSLCSDQNMDIIPESGDES